MGQTKTIIKYATSARQRMIRTMRDPRRARGPQLPMSFRRRIAWSLLGILVTTVTLASMPIPYGSSPALTPPPSSAPLQLLSLTDTIYLISRAAFAAARPDDKEEKLAREVTPKFDMVLAPKSSLPIAARSLHPIPGHPLAIRADATGYLPELIRPSSLSERLRLNALRDVTPNENKAAADLRLAYVTGYIDRSLFEDGQEAGLSDPLITDLTEIFAWDIDFALDVRAGDRFSVIHEEKYWQGQKIADGEIVAAEYINQGRVYRAIGYRDANGELNYYSPTGRVLKRTFLRTPVKFSRVTSLFSTSRYHPVLKTWRAHNGVDYSAPVGTPVQATASGRVVSVGWKGSYGKTVVLEHGGSYTTLYAHLSRYATNLREGQQIKQGAIIGYVGRTGLATGPHLHYELQIDGRHQNPLTFEFPEGSYINAKVRTDFWRAARVWAARLDLISGRTVASAN